MPSNIQMKLLDFKTNLILKRKFDAISSVPSTYDMINFRRCLPCENFPELRKFAQYVCRFRNDVHMQISIFVHEID